MRYIQYGEVIMIGKFGLIQKQSAIASRKSVPIILLALRY
jgi:hypothetical protein